MISILRQLTRYRNEDLAIQEQLLGGRCISSSTKYGFSGQIILFGGFAQKLNAAAITQPSSRISYSRERISDDAVKITRNITFELLF